MGKILARGHSRVPVYSGNPKNVIGLLLVMLLTLILHVSMVAYHVSANSNQEIVLFSRWRVFLQFALKQRPLSAQFVYAGFQGSAITILTSSLYYYVEW